MKVKKVASLVPPILDFAAHRGTAFTVIYGGLEIGDPEVEKQMVAWTEKRLADPSLNVPEDARRQLAEAMVNRHGASPTPEQWAKDPLLSRLKPSLAESLHGDIVRFATEVQGKRPEK
jgi:hypothetical protein